MDEKYEIREPQAEYNTTKKYTYSELNEMQEKTQTNNRYELIDGDLCLMSSPSVRHQDILGKMYIELTQYFKKSKCKVFISPLDVVIDGKKDKQSKNVVQPDLMIICDENKIKDNAIYGAPDLIIEILSQNNKAHDTLVKLNLYQDYNVKEYWIVDPKQQKVEIYVLNKDQKFQHEGIYYLDKEIESTTFKGMKIKIDN